MRVVFDTNIIISGLLFPGKQRHLLNYVIDHTLELIISHPIIEEINDVINRDKFKVHRELSIITVAEIIELAKLVYPTMKLNIVENDPDDNAILECAVEGGAQYIITGDSDLLIIKEYAGITIIDSSSFLSMVEKNEFQ